MVVGVLALQGDFAEHRKILADLHVESIEVRTAADLSRCDALIIPGGESTVMMKFLRDSGLDADITRRAEEGMPIFGTCAGAILLSDSHLRLMDISVERNAYGRQTESFDADIAITSVGTVQASFIRAPVLTRMGEGVDVLASYNTHPVLVRQGNLLAATFHTETTGESAVHELFLASCRLLQK